MDVSVCVVFPFVSLIWDKDWSRGMLRAASADFETSQCPRNNHSVHRVCIAIALASSEKLGFGTYSALLSPEKLGFGTHSALFSQEKTRVWDSQCITFPGETRVCALVFQDRLLFRVQ